MILCPNCQHHEISGALFCSECAAQLAYPEMLSTQAIYRSQSDRVLGSSMRATKNPLPPNPAPADAVVSIVLLDRGEIIPLAGRNEFTLGRVAEGQPILPDIDLSQYEAYAQGVSRLHAILKIKNDAVAIMDLGSSNGSRVNGQKIPPNSDFTLSHGDVISLGKFKIQLILRQ